MEAALGNSAPSNPVPSTSHYIPDIPHKDTKGLWIFGESDSKRRIVVIERQNGSYGFTLQSYGVRYKHGNRETDFITYVNAVEKRGAAHQAGLREGDVILSINGQNMSRVEHKSLVNFIRQCPANLKMVVVSDERARKVELHMRYVHLQKKLQDKVRELEELNAKEKQILAGTYTKRPCGGSLLDPCMGAAACCFCPPAEPAERKGKSHSALANADSSPSTILKTNSEAEELKLRHVIQQRSKSVKLPSQGSGKSSGGHQNSGTEEGYFYDPYRKCQSSRELSCSHSSTNRKDSISKTSGSHSTHQTLIDKHHHSEQHQKHDKTGQLKPKSWDSLVATGNTKSFGGYGYGFGYGYFPPGKDMSHGHHPHHHNHHSHSSHPQSYYTSKSQKHSCGDGSASKVKVVYNYVAPTYHTHLPNMVNLDESSRSVISSNVNTPTKRFGAGACSEPKNASGLDRSKTLPSSAKGGLNSTKSNPAHFPKLEKTFSDSSLSDQYKDFSKTGRYFKRSGDNVRFSSEEEFEIYRVGHTEPAAGRSKSKSAKERERIFV